MGPLGMQEMIALFVIALLLFGPKKLPELGRTLGKALSEFRRAKSELKATFESHMNEIEKETRIDMNSGSAPTYSYPYDDYGQQDYSYDSGASPALEKPSEPEKHEPQKQLTAATESSSNGAHGDGAVASTAQTPVADTVPRLNGVQPITRTAEKEHQG